MSSASRTIDAEHNFVLDPAQFWVFEQMILGSDYANYQLLKANGTATLGAYHGDVL